MGALSVAGLVAQETNVSGDGPAAENDARFAPTSIRADVSHLVRRRTAACWRSSWRRRRCIDALFLRQVWAGNEAMLLDLAHDHDAGGPRAAALLPDQQGSVVAARSRRGVRAGRAGQAGRRQLLSRRARRRPRSSAGFSRSPEPERARATGFFTTVRRSGSGFVRRAA